MDRAQQFPRWPQNSAGSPVLRVEVDLAVDDLFHLMWQASSPFVEEANAARGYRQYNETPWEFPEVEGGAVDGARGVPPGKCAHIPQGAQRKTNFTASTMGLKFSTEELQTCTLANVGKEYEVESCVATTATYGDKIRTVIRHRMVARSSVRSLLQVDYAVVYVSSVKKMVKPMITSGVDQGLKKNFATLIDVLRKRTTLRNLPEPLSPRPPPAPSPSVPTPRGLAPVPRWAPVLRLGVTDELVAALQPLVARALAPVYGTQGGNAAAVAVILALASLLVGLAVALSFMQQLQAMAAVGTGWLPSTVWWLLRVAGVPDSLRQVGSSLVLCAIVQAGANAVLVRWPKQDLRGLGLARRASTSSDGRAVKYEGYDNAIQRITANSSAAAEGGGPPPAEGDAKDARSSWKSGLSGFQRWFLGKGSAPSPASPDEAAGDAATGSSTPQPEQQPADAAAASREHSGSGGGGGALGGGGSPTTSSRPFSPEALMRKLSRPGSGRDWTVAEQQPQPSGGSGSQRRAAAAPAPSDNLSSLLKASWSHFIAENSGAATPAEAPGAGQEGAEPAGAGVVELRSLRGGAAGDCCEELVYENERFQPLRGWGHTWPGHFLPTDRVAHWSTPDGRTSAAFDEVAPRLEEGWDWVEPRWRVARGGAEAGLLDEDGWRYAIDFSVMKPLPNGGSGKMKLKDFVRRRSWTRTRVRREELVHKTKDPTPHGTEAAASGEEEEVEEEAAGRASPFNVARLQPAPSGTSLPPPTLTPLPSPASSLPLPGDAGEWETASRDGSGPGQAAARSEQGGDGQEEGAGSEEAYGAASEIAPERGAAGRGQGAAGVAERIASRRAEVEAQALEENAAAGTQQQSGPQASCAAASAEASQQCEAVDREAGGGEAEAPAGPHGGGEAGSPLQGGQDAHGDAAAALSPEGPEEAASTATAELDSTGSASGVDDSLPVPSDGATAASAAASGSQDSTLRDAAEATPRPAVPRLPVESLCSALPPPVPRASSEPARTSDCAEARGAPASAETELRATLPLWRSGSLGSTGVAAAASSAGSPANRSPAPLSARSGDSPSSSSSRTTSMLARQMTVSMRDVGASMRGMGSAASSMMESVAAKLAVESQSHSLGNRLRTLSDSGLGSKIMSLSFKPSRTTSVEDGEQPQQQQPELPTATATATATATDVPTATAAGRRSDSGAVRATPPPDPSGLPSPLPPMPFPSAASTPSPGHGTGALTPVDPASGRASPAEPPGEIGASLPLPAEVKEALREAEAAEDWSMPNPSPALAVDSREAADAAGGGGVHRGDELARVSATGGAGEDEPGPA